MTYTLLHFATSCSPHFMIFLWSKVTLKFHTFCKHQTSKFFTFCNKIVFFSISFDKTPADKLAGPNFQTESFVTILSNSVDCSFGITENRNSNFTSAGKCVVAVWFFRHSINKISWYFCEFSDSINWLLSDTISNTSLEIP